MDRVIRAASHATQAPFAGQAWLSAATQESVQECNEHVLALMRAQCEVGLAQGPLAQDVSGLLLDLDTASIRRAAGSAVLLVDAGFRDAGLWSDAIIGAVNERRPPLTPFFTVDGAVDVMRQVVTHAWHLARSEPTAARLLLGLSASSLGVIGGCSLSRLTRLAESRSDWLRPRWENRPTIWRDLLRTARENDSEALERIRLRGLRLLAAEARQG